MRIVCLSDTHGYHDAVTVPEADVLIVAGDFSSYGRLIELHEFNQWLGKQPTKHKIVVAGNHDKNAHQLGKQECKGAFSEAIYLEDEEVVIDGIKFYGSPWTPIFFDWYFMLPRGPELRAKWDLIPNDTDVLITHGPPAGKCDWSPYGQERVGCDELRTATERVRPSYHIFGHVHSGYGTAFNEHTVYVNASSCNERYAPVNEPVVLEI